MHVHFVLQEVPVNSARFLYDSLLLPQSVSSECYISGGESCHCLLPNRFFVLEAAKFFGRFITVCRRLPEHPLKWNRDYFEGKMIITGSFLYRLGLDTHRHLSSSTLLIPFQYKSSQLVLSICLVALLVAYELPVCMGTVGRLEGWQPRRSVIYPLHTLTAQLG